MYTKAYFRKGKALLALKDYEEAEDVFQKGLVVEPQNTELRRELESAQFIRKYSNHGNEIDTHIHPSSPVLSQINLLSINHYMVIILVRHMTLTSTTIIN